MALGRGRWLFFFFLFFFVVFFLRGAGFWFPKFWGDVWTPFFFLKQRGTLGKCVVFWSILEVSSGMTKLAADKCGRHIS